jgi:hypothetical protein
MADEDPPRSLAARAAAELALIRIANHYGGRPEFVLLGGLVPDLLCAQSGTRHAGTTDVDVQVDLEKGTHPFDQPADSGYRRCYGKGEATVHDYCRIRRCSLSVSRGVAEAEALSLFHLAIFRA